MDSKKSIIYLSPTLVENDNKRGQTVGFINILNGSKISAAKPIRIPYDEKAADDIVLLNYTGKEIDKPFGEAYMTGSETSPVDVFKQEIDIDSKGNITPITSLSLVGKNVSSYHFSDYNISNGRHYRYKIYLSQDHNLVQSEKPRIPYIAATLKTCWQMWSITELHPTDNTGTNFTASKDDVWLFNLNLSSGEQQQNISRNEQQTLGEFPKYSQGMSNYVSGSLSCLLGVDVFPARGYVEERRYSSNITSNQRVDMLNQWRRMVYSKNPKLLKDREGQKFLITITNATNSPMDAVKNQPNTINFSWTQLGSADDITVVGTFDKKFIDKDECRAEKKCGCDTCGICDSTVQSDIEGILNTST